MTLNQLLTERQDKITMKWYNRIVDTYSTEYTKFLSAQKNRFRNPVGYTFTTACRAIVEVMLSDRDIQECAESLEEIIKIRSVQDLTCEETLCFVFLLKDVIRTELCEEITSDQFYTELLAFESRVDQLALLAFSIYMRSREKLYQIRADELRRQTYKLLERSRLFITQEGDNGHNEL